MGNPRQEVPCLDSSSSARGSRRAFALASSKYFACSTVGAVLIARRLVSRPAESSTPRIGITPWALIQARVTIQARVRIQARVTGEGARSISEAVLFNIPGHATVFPGAGPIMFTRERRQKTVNAFIQLSVCRARQHRFVTPPTFYPFFYPFNFIRKRALGCPVGHSASSKTRLHPMSANGGWKTGSLLSLATAMLSLSHLGLARARGRFSGWGRTTPDSSRMTFVGKHCFRDWLK